MTGELTAWIAHNGAYAVFALMALDALLPLGGELTMLYAGALAGGAISGAHATLFGFELATGLQGYVVLSLAGVLGSLAGALLGWGLGARGRRLRAAPEKLALAERWFERFGDAAVLLGRLTPVVRSFISMAAGALGQPLARYTVLTLTAALIWCFAFAGAGWVLGTAWTTVHHDFRYADAIAAAGAVAVLAVVGLRHRRRGARRPARG